MDAVHFIPVYRVAHELQLGLLKSENWPYLSQFGNFLNVVTSFISSS
jgi:hypothetical protein